jgi:hypothetical protein
MISYMLDGTTLLGKTLKIIQLLDSLDSMEEKLVAAKSMRLHSKVLKP